jgi:tetratricopeptide (TPR) repeat protein
MTTELGKQVNELIGQNRLTDAHNVLLQAQTSTPNDPQIEYELGLFCLNTGKFDESEVHFKNCLAKGLESGLVHYHLGLSLLRQDKAAEALSTFREACERDPSLVLAHFHWGLALHQMGNYRGALGQLNQAIKLNPELTVAYYQAGLTSHELGLYQEAIKLYATACKMDPKFSHAYNALGVTMASLGRYAEACRLFAEANKHDKDSVLAARSWAYALYQLGKYDEAMERYKEAFSLASPESLDAAERALLFNDWGVALHRIGHYEEAAEKLVQAVDINPQLQAAKLNLAVVQLALAAYELAARNLEELKEAGLFLPEIQKYTGVSYFMQKHYEGALEGFLAASDNPKKDPELALWLGFTFIALGQVEEAREYFQSVLEEDNKNFLAYDGLGVALALAHDHSTAIEKFKQALSVNSNFAMARWHLGRSLEALGHPQEAQDEFELAVLKDEDCLLPEKELLEFLLLRSANELVLSRSLKLLEVTPHDLDVQLSLARALKAENHFEDCEEVLNRILQDHPKSARAYSLLGQLYLSQGNLVDADERFRLGSNLADSEAELYYYWGKTLALLGFHELALEKFEKACDIDPFDPDVYEAWGATLKSMGRFSDASEVFRKASEYIFK